MPEFNSPTDIGNRALQRVGSELMNSSQGFSEASKRAQAVSFCYGKLRRAELQRNTWTFATRRAALRAICSQTAVLLPTVFSQTVTYFVGSIVEDSTGTLWESIQRNNKGNDPQNSPFAWEPYFGPQTAEPFNSSTFFTPPTVSISPTFSQTTPNIAYYKSELVYTIKGDGTYNVYKSLCDGNGVHPALPNQWSVDTIFKTDDVVNVYPAWSSVTTYTKGQTVGYTDGNTYTSLVSSNLNHIPPSSPTQWVLMPTLTLQSQFNFQNSTNVTPQIMLPGTTPINEWNILATYGLGSFVIWNATIYVSLINSNTGNFPSNATDWAACTGGTLYQSLVDFNLGNTPASSPSQWTTTFTLGGGNPLWIQIGGSAFPNGVAIGAFQLTYPIGSGPVTETWTKNAYMLPGNYLARASQDPSAGRGPSWLGSPGNLSQTDWVIENGFLVTSDSWPIILRFVADVQNVAPSPGKEGFHDLFCEMLSCSIALEICEPLTQSTAKKQVIGQEYKLRRTEAITKDAIETGAETPPLDDFVACRY